MKEITIIGGGLSGCEAAWQAAERGITVNLYEMRPLRSTGAHQTDRLAEIICSNSFGSNLPTRPSGLLMNELEKLGSHLIEIARTCQVPAGHALAIDRDEFSQKVSHSIIDHPNINVIRKEMVTIPSGITIIASGPLTSERLANEISSITKSDNLFFYDAVAPIIDFESIIMEIAFWGSRYGRGEQERGDYINCPFDKETYNRFVSELVNAERINLKYFEREINDGVRTGRSKFFEGCLPIEVMAKRGEHTLAFGPLRPIGLTNPHNSNKPYAVVQLRQDDKNGDSFNLVGFQTNLTISDQKRVFRMIPGLEKADFLRYGQMHRNTFILSPKILNTNFQLKSNKDIYFAGQITGVEGYLANIASGLFVGINVARRFHKKIELNFSKTMMIGALFNYVTSCPEDAFQPMKANFGLLPPLDKPTRPKRVRYEAYSARAQQDIDSFLANNDL